MNQDLQVYIPCCDASLPIVKINSYLFNKFWPSVKVNYLGFSSPDFNFYNDNHKFHKLADKQEGGANKWTRYIHDYLKTIDDKHIIFSIDDYWLCQEPNMPMINEAINFARLNTKVGRFDLTFDSQVEGSIISVNSLKQKNIFLKHPQARYRVSTQPAIWKLEYLLKILDNDWSPWQFELNGTVLAASRYSNENHTFAFADNEMINYPLRTIAKGAVSRHNPGKYNVLGFSFDTIKELVAEGFFTEDELIWGQWQGNVPSFKEKGGYEFDIDTLDYHPTSKTHWKEYRCIYDNKTTINLFDNCFSHTQDLWGYVSSNGNNAWGRPKNVNYKLKLKKFDGITMFTDHYLGDRNFIKSIQSPTKIAWLCESPHIHPWAHNLINKTHDLFDLIITYDKNLTSQYDNCVYANIMETRVLPQNCGVHQKNKLTSLIAANKKMTKGHQLRFEIAEKYAQKYSIDLWGSAFKKFNMKVEPLKDYCFSITAHNCKINDYYTDALIDCFMLGTVPIFWGCPNIGDYFDEKGIITFDTVDELDKILQSLSFELYETMLPHIKNNYQIAKKYQITKDDQIYNVIKEHINEN